MSFFIRRCIAAIALASLSAGLLSCDHGPTSPAPSKSVSTPPSHPEISGTWAGGVALLTLDGQLLLDGGRDPGMDSYSSEHELLEYLFTVELVDVEGNPVPNQNVQLYIPRSSYWGLTEGYDYLYCVDQSNGIYDTPVQHQFVQAVIFELTTDELGMANFIIKGWNPSTSVGNSGPYNNWGKGQVYVNGLPTGQRFNVCTPNLDGAVGIDGGDMSHFLSDFLADDYHARCDYDNDGEIGGADLSYWLTFFTYKGFRRNCN